MALLFLLRRCLHITSSNISDQSLPQAIYQASLVVCLGKWSCHLNITIPVSLSLSLQQPNWLQSCFTADIPWCNLHNNWQLTYASVCYLLWNRATYGGKILHADTCRLCVTHGLGLISIGVIVTIYFHPIQHHFYLTEGKQNTKLAECHIPYTVPSANIFTIQCVYGRRQITFSTDSARKAPDGWSTQCDRHSSRNPRRMERAAR